MNFERFIIIFYFDKLMLHAQLGIFDMHKHGRRHEMSLGELRLIE
jgi:hypothetical protein